MRRLVAGTTAVVVAVGVTWLTWSDGQPQPRSAGEQVQQSAPPGSTAPSPAPSPPPPSSRSGSSAGDSSRSGPCDDVSRAFAPRTISVPGVVPPATVVTPARDANGVPGVPPLTNEGKSVFAWDRAQGIRPGDPKGNVLLNAHTWPDGSALGNRLLAGLDRGDRVVVGGGGKRLCYRVTERVEVPAERRMTRYYETDGPPQLAIVVCSGRRLGPGHWENRTVWFASPAA